MENLLLKETEVANALTYEQEEKIKIHEQLCEQLKNLYSTKNMDYGDSMHPLFEEYGMDAFNIMLQIKLSRIKSLSKSNGHYESLEDSLIDLANYALIAITELNYKRGNTKVGDM